MLKKLLMVLLTSSLHGNGHIHNKYSLAKAATELIARTIRKCQPHPQATLTFSMLHYIPEEFSCLLEAIIVMKSRTDLSKVTGPLSSLVSISLRASMYSRYE